MYSELVALMCCGFQLTMGKDTCTAQLCFGGKFCHITGVCPEHGPIFLLILPSMTPLASQTVLLHRSCLELCHTVVPLVLMSPLKFFT